MVKEIPSIGTQLHNFRKEHPPVPVINTSYVEVRNTPNDRYRMSVALGKDYLGIRVKNVYDRDRGRDDRPYVSGFDIEVGLTGEDFILGLKKSKRDEAMVGLGSVLKGGARGAVDILRDIHQNQGQPRFWVTVDRMVNDEKSGKKKRQKVKMGFFSDDNLRATCRTVVVDGEFTSQSDASRVINELRESGFDTPEFIFVGKTIDSLLTESKTSKQMREEPFVAQYGPYREPKNYEREGSMLDDNQN